MYKMREQKNVLLEKEKKNRMHTLTKLCVSFSYLYEKKRERKRKERERGVDSCLRIYIASPLINYH
jgi:hypothetical protein